MTDAESRGQTLADNLRRLRFNAGLTQEQLGDRSGVVASTISRLERGQGDPSLSTVVAIARALDASVTDLLPGQGETP